MYQGSSTGNRAWGVATGRMGVISGTSLMEWGFNLSVSVVGDIWGDTSTLRSLRVGEGRNGWGVLGGGDSLAGSVWDSWREG
ncbi:hypothetical protein Tco_1490962 [Tanacetum coccineum]